MSSLRTIYKRLRSIAARWYHCAEFCLIRIKQQRRLRRIEYSNDRGRVVFFAMNVSMWRYQALCEALARNNHFDVNVVLSPCATYSIEQQRKDIAALKEYFAKHQTPYIDHNFEAAESYDVRQEIDPDILFYPQPYPNILCAKHDISNFEDRLLCYYPYAFWTAYGSWSYDTRFHNIAWKLYYSTKLHLKDAQRLALNRGRNVVVVGYPNADNFLHTPTVDVWKSQPKAKKRIIWAPHFTISKERSLVAHSSFLWMADLMLEIAEQYRDSIQIAFKPHPRLLTELCLHPEWGEERAINYYQKWRDMANGQLEDGEFKDLFMTSDAMIHDSSSFTVEYHYSLKPVIYVQEDVEAYASTLSEFGRLALDAHYKGKNREDIIDFVERIVLGNEDEMLAQRQAFYEDYLLPPYGHTVCENTVIDLLKSLKRDE